MAAARAPKSRTCPVTLLPLEYTGRGRPPVFHPSATAKQRREYRNAK